MTRNNKPANHRLKGTYRRRRVPLRSEGYNLRSGPVGQFASFDPSEAETHHNHRSSSPDSGSRSGIDPSESMAEDMLTNLKEFVRYDQNWRRIRDKSDETAFSFNYFPWPAFGAVNAHSFLERVTKETVDSFLFHPTRIFARDVDRATLRKYELMNWAKGRALQTKVRSSDLGLVTAAYAIVSLYLHDDASEEEIQHHKMQFSSQLLEPYHPPEDFTESEMFQLLAEFTPSILDFPPTPRIGSPEPDYLPPEPIGRGTNVVGWSQYSSQSNDAGSLKTGHHGSQSQTSTMNSEGVNEGMDIVFPSYN